MVVFDFKCLTEGCENNGKRFESLLKRWDSPNPNCPKCGVVMERQLAAPRTIWVKPWAEYGARPQDKESPTYNPDGITVVRRKSSGLGYDVPEKCFLQTRQEVKEYCKQEGLAMPDEMSPNAEISKDGKSLSTAGMPGQWV